MTRFESAMRPVGDPVGGAEYHLLCGRANPFIAAQYQNIGDGYALPD